MRIFKFEEGIKNAIKVLIDLTLPSIKDNIKYFDYELPPNQLSSYEDSDIAGAVAVYVRNTKFPVGSQNGDWQGDNILEIDCFGFSTGGYQDVSGENVITTAAEFANIRCQAIITAAYLAVTERITLENSFGVVDENEKKIIIGEKEPLEIELFTQEDIEGSQIAESVRKLKVRISLNEKTLPLTPGEILTGFNTTIEAFKSEKSYEDSQQ